MTVFFKEIPANYSSKPQFFLWLQYTNVLTLETLKTGPNFLTIKLSQKSFNLNNFSKD